MPPPQAQRTAPGPTAAAVALEAQAARPQGSILVISAAWQLIEIHLR